ncbi:hypothetical protein ACVWY2_004730 [Bradyrhizobium sp. JR6.1]
MVRICGWPSAEPGPDADTTTPTLMSARASGAIRSTPASTQSPAMASFIANPPSKSFFYNAPAMIADRLPVSHHIDSA